MRQYRSAGPDEIAITDGPDMFNQVLMGDGVWYLQAGDRPALRLAHRPYWPNSYIKPDLIPGLGISGDLYFAALTGGGEVPLHVQARAEARFSPGEAQWRCSVPSPGEAGPSAPFAATPIETHIRTRAAATHAAHTYGLEPDIPPEFDLQWELPPLPPRYEPLPGLPFQRRRAGSGPLNCAV